jgi:thiamine monophosphate synthase
MDRVCTVFLHVIAKEGVELLRSQRGILCEQVDNIVRGHVRMGTHIRDELLRVVNKHCGSAYFFVGHVRPTTDKDG